MTSLTTFLKSYPIPFWILFIGVLLSMSFNSFIWPFVTIFISEQTQLALSFTTLMFTFQASASILTVGKTSRFMDLYGRKKMMVLGLILHAVTLLLMSEATSILSWIILMFFFGAVSPVFPIGANAMVADLLPRDQRPSAYALLRTSINLGIVIGPLIGGWIITQFSFSMTYWLASMLLIILAFFAALIINETQTNNPSTKLMNKTSIWSDHQFIRVIFLYTMAVMGFVQMFLLLPIYLKQQFNILENQSSLLFSVNAIIVVSLQYVLTRWTEKFSPLLMMSFGALIYSLAIGSLTFWTIFNGFIFAMVLLTIGELIINPTVTTYVANIAPEHMRAQYMGMLEMVYRFALGISPLIGGILNDFFFPEMIWIFSTFLSLIGSVGFLKFHFLKKVQDH